MSLINTRTRIVWHMTVIRHQNTTSIFSWILPVLILLLKLAVQSLLYLYYKIRNYYIKMLMPIISSHDWNRKGMISVNRDHYAVISQTCSVFEMLTHWFSQGKCIIYTRGNIRNNILVLWPCLKQSQTFWPISCFPDIICLALFGAS